MSCEIKKFLHYQLRNNKFQLIVLEERQIIF